MTLVKHLAISLSCNDSNFSALARVPINLLMNFLDSRNRGPDWVRTKTLFPPTISPNIMNMGLSE